MYHSAFSLGNMQEEQAKGSVQKFVIFMCKFFYKRSSLFVKMMSQQPLLQNIFLCWNFKIAAASSTVSVQFWVFLILFDFHFPFTFC